MLSAMMSPMALPSPESALPSPQWAPPRSPLPPHRLAKLANALGVSTPIPATQPPSPYMFHSNSLPNTSPAADQPRRSPTPSAASAISSFPQPTSKYLLHVIPPLHLPHDSEFSDDTTPPPPHASGYHKQFKRGILVPVYPSLQLQLAAIAREYALPSTAGLLLYLVNSKSPTGPPTPPMVSEDPDDEPGPLLSDDVWRHLWARVLRAEHRDDPAFATRSATPSTLALGLGIVAKSSPHLLADALPIRSASSKDTLDSSHSYPLTPSSTPSITTVSTAELHLRSKSNASSLAQSDPETPDTSVPDLSQRANSLDLPGLNSASIIPILAKVEFDIDRRKSPWYDPWLRSRKNNHILRAESRNARRLATSDGTSDSPRDRRPLLDLKLTERTLTSSPISLHSYKDREVVELDGEEDVMIVPEDDRGGYQALSDSQSGSDLEEDGVLAEPEDDDEDDEDEEEDATARIPSMPGVREPLSDVFGTDAETWAELRRSQPHIKLQPNPNLVGLALTSADLERLPDVEDHEGDLTKSEDEIHELLSEMARPRLSLTIPPSPPQAQVRAKHIPPPLVLQNPSSNSVVPTDASPNLGDVRLAYLNNSETESEDQANFLQGPESDDLGRERSPAESEKREGAFFDDLDLGLDLTEEFDENDPNDHRKSQYLMRAQLDQIEKTLAQFSPRDLRADLSDDISLTLSPKSGELRNADVLPSTPGISPRSERLASGRMSPSENKAWPAVPFSALRDSTIPQPSDQPSPPQLAVNGVTTSAPKSFFARPPSTMSISAETQSRLREQQEQDGSYSPMPPSSAGHMSPATDSPVIPLSPDPFGRYPSSPIPSGSRPAPPRRDSDRSANDEALPEGSRPASAAPSSRFSADSITGEDAVSKSLKSSSNGTLMSVKSIKKLWRKSNKNSISASSSQSLTNGRTSPGPVPQRPGRPSNESLDLPSIPPVPAAPNFGMMSPQSSSHPDYPQQAAGGLNVPPSRVSLAPPFPPPAPPHKLEPSLAQLHFDQESPYPTRLSPTPRYSARPPSPNYGPPPPPPEKEKSSVRKSILKWKSGSGRSSSQGPAIADSRTSLDRAAPPGVRPRRGSVNNLSPPSTSSEIPPSPRIPEHFLTARNNGAPVMDNMHRHSVRSKMSSVDSTGRPRSVTSSLAPSTSPPTSSRDSQETRPSFDASGFEMVSPRTTSGLSYPYHALDHN